MKRIYKPKQQNGMNMTSKLFSVKQSEVHTIYTFLGIKLKVKKKSYRKIGKNFIKHYVRPKTILIAEINNCHWETIPGYCKYLTDLGYNVDIITRTPAAGIFNSIHAANVKIFECDKTTFDKIFANYNFSKYERIIYNSRRVYFKKNDLKNEGYDLKEYYAHIPEGQKPNLYIQHHIDKIQENPYDKQIILANPLKESDLDNLVVNPHYFGPYDTKDNLNKDIIKFISIGELSDKRRNANLLVSAIRKLHNSGCRNFKVTVIGRGEIEKIDPEIQKYFEILGWVDYPVMFEEINKSDFILPLLDPQIESHKRYMQGGTSGTFQLSYGFLKPCIIHKAFADIYNFDKHNSIVYNNNDEFGNAIKYAVNLTNTEYKEIIRRLHEKERDIYQNSLKNLQEHMLSAKKQYDIVSLGEDCMIRRYLTRAGLKPTKKLGELSTPFDLAVTPLSSLIEILENNFSDYFNDLSYSDKYDAWMNKKYEILYNHDTDCLYSDKEKLINRFTRRIKNFKSIVTNSPFIFFVCKSSESRKHINILYRKLKEIRNKHPFKLIILDLEQKNKKIIKNNLSIYPIDHPFVDKNLWWQDISSEDSNDFQDKIKKIIEDEISSKFKISRFKKEDINVYNGHY